MKATIINGDAVESLRTLPDESVQMCVTSPPYYGLRDYGVEGQIGLEETPEQFIANLVAVFREMRRVLKDDGTLWVNIGDSYAGSGKGPAGNLGKTHNERWLEDIHSKIIPDGMKPKDLIGIPWMLAFALRADGWYLRQDIIWHKPNPMPESVKDRCTKAHEYIFLLSKSQKYYFDSDAIAEPSLHYATDSRAGKGNIQYREGKRDGTDGNGQHSFVTINPTRNKRSVWSVNVKGYKDAHFATFPEELITPCILAGSREGDTVLDCFNGSGTTGAVSIKNERNYIGIELNPEYVELTKKRLNQVQTPLFPTDIRTEEVH